MPAMKVSAIAMTSLFMLVSRGVLARQRANDRAPPRPRRGLIGVKRAIGWSGRPARSEAEPPSHAGMVLRRPCQKVVPASLAAEAQAPVMMADQPELSAAVGAAVLQFAHDDSPPVWRLDPSASYACLRPTPRRVHE